MHAHPSRREFLRRAAAGVAATAIRPEWTAPVPRAPAPQRIIVIGAGMAGLGAAHELRGLGHDVTILEARARPGGRVFTLREPFADGLYAEGGAIQVFDSHARVQKYLTLLDLPTDLIHPPPLASITHVMGKRVLARPGEPLRWPFALTPGEQDPQRGSLVAQYVNAHLEGISDAEAKGTLLETHGHLDRITFTEFLRQQGASAPAIAILNVGLVSGLGDGGDHVSALDLLREAAHRALRTQSSTIRGGSDRLPRALAARLSDRIHFGTPVTRLEQDDHGVRAIAQAGGTTRTFEGDRMVCTIPFSVLRRLQVSPAVSREKRAAIDGLRYTSVTRTYVQTRTRFWVDQGLGGSASTDLPVMSVLERSINQPGTRGILESYQAGAHARRSTAMSIPDRVAAALRGLEQVYPGMREFAQGGSSKSWDDDEWSRGAYAWYAPGEMASFLPHAARAEGRIHFAGDHTSSSPGWMEGALESAERVVQEMVRSVG